MNECPKCQAECGAEDIECKKCGIIFAKFERYREKIKLANTNTIQADNPEEKIDDPGDNDIWSGQQYVPNKEKPSMILTVGGGFIIICIAYAIYLQLTIPTIEHRKPQQSRQATIQEQTEAIKNAVKESLSLKFTWTKEGFGNIMSADFIINNASNLDIKDITISCGHYGNSKTLIDTSTSTIFEIFNKQSTKEIKDFNMGFIHSQVVSSECDINDFTLL